jgi:hypothetical protein
MPAISQPGAAILLPMSRKHRIGLLFAITSLSLGGCKQAEELAAKARGEETPEATEDAKDETKKDDPAAEGGGGADKVEPEPIPVEAMHSGLDLMLSFVPDDKHQFVIVRDATVLTEYWEEALRFVDTPVAKLSAAEGAPDDFKSAPMLLELGKGQGKQILDSLAASGLKLEEGVALIIPPGNKDKPLLVFNADSPDALSKIASQFGGQIGTAQCVALEGFEKWNVCADDKAVIDAYKPTEDPTTVRALVASRLPGVELDEANVIAHVVPEGEGAVTVSISTLPGLFHLAATGPFDKEPELAQALASLEGGDQKTLSNVQPGAGFVWGRAKSSVLAMAAASAQPDTPPEAKKVLEAMTGEFVIAGSVDPGGLVFKASLNDTSAFTPFIEWTLKEYEKEGGSKPIPDVPGSKVMLERVELDGGGTKANALHLAVEGIPQADVIKAFAGIYFDGWAFASADSLIVAAGPNKESVGKLLSASGDGPSADMLASLPQPLARGLERKDVSFAIHMPMDFLQGAHMHKIVQAGLKEVPDLKPDVVLAALSLLSPLSSASMWLEQPASGTPVFHLAVLGIGNRATAEGKEALDAAHAITEGTAPESAFMPLADKYKSSAMAFAYTTRAGSEGPGSLVGSGVGPLLIGGVMAYAMMEGKANEGMAADLGVDPAAAAPDLVPETLPVAPVHEAPVPVPEEKKTVQPKPKRDPKPVPEPEPEPDPKKGKRAKKEGGEAAADETKKGKKGKKGKKAAGG